MEQGNTPKSLTNNTPHTPREMKNRKIYTKNNKETGNRGQNV